MDKIYIENKVLDVLEENGILIEEDRYFEVIDMDSLMYISVMVSIEEAFELEISYEYIDYLKWNTLNKIINNVEHIYLEEKHNNEVIYLG